MTIRCAYGDIMLYPVAQRELKVDRLPLCVKLLQASILLGTNVAELHQSFGESLTHTPAED